MIHPFQPKISHHWHKHADGLEHIREVSLAAGGGNHRTQQVVKPENVHHIKILQPRPAVTLDRRIPTHSPVMQPCWHIDGLHAILIPPPTKRRPFSGDFFFRSLQSLFQSPVGGENGDLMASPRQTFGKRAHLYRGAAEFDKGSVRVRAVQDSDCSRRIFFSDFAKTLKRNSCSARCRPRAPISLACAGLASKVSMQVARWIGSPCGTRYPDTPSSMISGAPPCAPPMTGLPHAMASRYTRPNPSPWLGKAKISHAE